MKFLPLIWAILWRKRVHTWLSLLSIVFAFSLFGMLQGIDNAFRQTVDRANVNRLVVTNSISFTENLPYADLQQIERIPGVTSVSDETWFGSHFQDPKNFVAAFAVEPEREFRIYPELIISPTIFNALTQSRVAAVAGASLATKYGWKKGDHITLRSSTWTRADSGDKDWEFELVGTFLDPEDRSQEDAFLFNYRYLDEARATSKGRVDRFIVQVENPKDSSSVANAIDSIFRNSADETKTQTEKEFQQSFLKQIGDIHFMTTYILCAVFFSLILSIGSTMGQSFRQQLPELAVLKTLGFSDSKVALLVICQSVFLCIIGSSAGLLLAFAAFPFVKDVVGDISLQPSTFAQGIVVAIAMGLLIVVIPSARAKRVTIVEQLR